MRGRGTSMRTHRTTRTGRGRRSLGGLVAAMLAVGVMTLPALPASAWSCKVNAAQDPTEEQIQAILDSGPSVVTFYGACAGDFEVSRNLTIAGSGIATVTAIDVRAFQVYDGAIVTFRTLRITGGAADGGDDSGEGGGIEVDDASVTLDRVTVFDNAAINGGGVHVDEGGSLVVLGSTFRGNQAVFGGAIDVDSAEVRISGSTFQANGAEAEGGAVRIDHSWDGCSQAPGTTIDRSTFTANTSGLVGGAVWSDSADVTITGTTFTRNSARQWGGAIIGFDDCEEEPLLSIASSSFTSNLAWEGAFTDHPAGGAVFVTSLGTLQVTNSRFTSNRSYLGGAIFSQGDVDFGEIEEICDDTEISVTGSTFTSNRAEWDGGAVLVDDDFDEGWENQIVHTFANSTFTANTAGRGGALSLFNAPFEVRGSTFTRNTAVENFGKGTSGGGAIFFENYLGYAWNTGDEYVIAGSRFISNTSNLIGGAVSGTGYYGEGFDTLSIEGSTFTGNRARVDGGAVHISTVYTGVFDSTFSSNSAALNGGAIALRPSGGDPYFTGNLYTDDGTVFTGNRAMWGGAVSTLNADLFFMGVATGNVAANLGGAIAFEEESVDLESLGSPDAEPTDGAPCVEMVVADARIERNTATGGGGGIYFGSVCSAFVIIDDFGPVSISYNRVLSRVSGVGGGILIEGADELLLLTADDAEGTIVIQRNSAPIDGGGMYAEGVDGPIDLDEGVLFAYNTTGGFFLEDCFTGGPWDEAYVGNVEYGFSDYDCVP